MRIPVRVLTNPSDLIRECLLWQKALAIPGEGNGWWSGDESYKHVIRKLGGDPG